MKKNKNFKEKITVSIREAAEITSLSIPYLYKLSAEGELPVIKVGTRNLIFKDELVEWLKSKKRKLNDE
ncbi:MAG: excisionase family DNA-binding protein [Candidatus Dadabacteria bacterium]|nr:excisionase family DNA-binding protein [Candidatus Dadabacteria bacterium]